MTADAYLQNQSTKQSSIKTDPLADLLNNINKNPAAYTNKQALNIDKKDKQCNEQISNNDLQQGAKDIEQCTKRAIISHEEGADVPRDNKPAIQGSEVKGTRSGCMVKKLDRLTYV